MTIRLQMWNRRGNHCVSFDSSHAEAYMRPGRFVLRMPLEHCPLAPNDIGYARVYIDDNPVGMVDAALAVGDGKITLSCPMDDVDEAEGKRFFDSFLAFMEKHRTP